jgi:DNA methylase
MFPESFAATWIERLTKPRDLVLDPFCGRGTAPFQALLMDRQAIGGDINPVAYCVTKAKTNAPHRSSLYRRLTRLEGQFEPGGWEEERERMGEFFHQAFAPRTLSQILFLRATLKWQASNVDCMLAALILGALHGESKRSSAYLSNQMPRTISTKPGYSVRFWRKHGFQAPERDTFALLRRLIEYRYASAVPKSNANVLRTDFRDLPRLLPSERRSVGLVITSPPYLDVTNFEEDQWLRLWFLGGPPRPTYRKVSKDDRHERPDSYWRLIADMWRVLGRLVKNDGNVVIRMGGRKLAPHQIVAGLEAASIFSKRSVELVSSEVSPIVKRQTDSFRPGSTGCAREVDCWFRMR